MRSAITKDHITELCVYQDVQYLCADVVGTTWSLLAGYMQLTTVHMCTSHVVIMRVHLMQMSLPHTTLQVQLFISPKCLLWMVTHSYNYIFQKYTNYKATSMTAF